MSGHVFVDETKRRDYLLVSVVIATEQLDPTRRTLRDLVMPGQRRLHMKDESNSRKGMLADMIAKSIVKATIYDAGRGHTERECRAACLEALVADIALRGDMFLILEQDDSLLSWDRQHLIEMTRRSDCSDGLRYEHHRAEQELLLSIPDAIAWCWARGGQWRDRVRPVVTDVRKV